MVWTDWDQAIGLPSLLAARIPALKNEATLFLNSTSTSLAWRGPAPTGTLHLLADQAYVDAGDATLAASILAASTATGLMQSSILALQSSTSALNSAIGAAVVGYKDQIAVIDAGMAGSTLTSEAYQDTPWLASYLRHDLNEPKATQFPMNYDWDMGSPVQVYLSCEPMVNATGTAESVALAGQYVWSTDGITAGTNGTWTTFTATQAVGTGAANQSVKVSLFTTATDTSLTQSSVLRVYWYRDSAGVDTYKTDKGSGTAEANLLVSHLGCHYLTDKIGASSGTL